MFISTLLIATFLLFPSYAFCEDKIVSLSVPDLNLKEHDRLTGFKVIIINGFVASVPKIPTGWFFDVDLPFQWKTEIKSGSIVGAADLTGDDRNFFHNFLNILDSGNEKEPMEISVEITVDRSMDEDKTETLVFDMKKLLIKRKDIGK